MDSANGEIGSVEPEVDDLDDRRWGFTLELLAVVLMSLTAIATAWTGFQSSKWSGIMSIRFSEAAANRTESVRWSNIAAQEVNLDASVFIAWVEAVAVGDAQLADFVQERFPRRLHEATEAWLATDPLDDPDAPTSPFVMDEYVNDATVEALRLEALAEERSLEAREANQRSDNYVLTTIVFASVLFFAALSSKLYHRRPRVLLLSVAGVAFVAAVGVVLSFPIQW
jgi:hypothetical protein